MSEYLCSPEEYLLTPPELPPPKKKPRALTRLKELLALHRTHRATFRERRDTLWCPVESFSDPGLPAFCESSPGFPSLPRINLNEPTQKISPRQPGNTLTPRGTVFDTPSRNSPLPQSCLDCYLPNPHPQYPPFFLQVSLWSIPSRALFSRTCPEGALAPPPHYPLRKNLCLQGPADPASPVSSAVCALALPPPQARQTPMDVWPQDAQASHLLSRLFPSPLAPPE